MTGRQDRLFFTENRSCDRPGCRDQLRTELLIVPQFIITEQVSSILSFFKLQKKGIWSDSHILETTLNEIADNIGIGKTIEQQIEVDLPFERDAGDRVYYLVLNYPEELDLKFCNFVFQTIILCFFIQTCRARWKSAKLCKLKNG